MKFGSYLAALAALIVFVVAPAQAMRFDSLRRGQREVSVLTGYGENHHFPACMREHIEFDQLKFRWGYMTSPTTEVAYEVWGGRQVEESQCFALSGVITYRRYFSLRGRTAFSYDLGFGGTHFEDKIQGLATRNNFTEQVGLTYHYSTGPSSAFVVEYKFCHVSNAGIKLPNVGINASTVSIGYTWYR